MDETIDTKLTALTARMKAHGKVEMALNGRSMEPYLLARDRARIVPYMGLSPGHLYLFKMPGSNEPAIHRLIRLSDDGAVLKGDQTGVFEHVPVDSLLGEVSALMLDGSTAWAARIYPFFQTCLARCLSGAIGVHCSNHRVTHKQLHILMCKAMDWLCGCMRKDLRKQHDTLARRNVDSSR
jgi:hypothetical protein